MKLKEEHAYIFVRIARENKDSAFRCIIDKEVKKKDINLAKNQNLSKDKMKIIVSYLFRENMTKVKHNTDIFSSIIEKYVEFESYMNYVEMFREELIAKEHCCWGILHFNDKFLLAIWLPDDAKGPDKMRHVSYSSTFIHKLSGLCATISGVDPEDLDLDYIYQRLYHTRV